MLDNKTLNIQIDGEFFKRIRENFKNLYYGAPKWLRYILITTLVCGSIYFMYARLKMSYDVDDVYEQVDELDKRLNQTIYSEQYMYDISNLVMTLKTLQTTNDDQTRCVLQFLDFLDECVRLHDSQSMTLNKIRVLREHIIMTSESNGNIIKHQIDTYDQWLERQGYQLHKNNSFDYNREDSIYRGYMHK